MAKISVRNLTPKQKEGYYSQFEQYRESGYTIADARSQALDDVLDFERKGRLFGIRLIQNNGDGPFGGKPQSPSKAGEIRKRRDNMIKDEERMSERAALRTDIWSLKRQDAALQELRKISRSLHGLAEVQCNFGLTPWQEKRQERLEKDAEALAWTLGLKAYHQMDPRGCALYLVPETLSDEEVDSNYSSYFAIC